MKINDLKKLGFNEKEAKVYISVLKIGQGSVQNIAKKAELPKSTVNDVIKSLIKKGVVSVFLQGKKRKYTANDPSILKKRAAQTQEALDKALPELMALYGGKSSKPRVRLLEAKAGLRVVLDEMLNEAKELVCLSSVEDVFTKLTDYFPKFPHERAKKKIPIQVIARESKMARERKATGPSELRQVKIMDTQIPFSSNFYAWNNKVALITLEEDFVIVVIESKDITDTIKAMFQWAWEK